MTLSPVTDEPVNLCNVPHRCFWSLPQCGMFDAPGIEIQITNILHKNQWSETLIDNRFPSVLFSTECVSKQNSKLPPFHSYITVQYSTKAWKLGKGAFCNANISYDIILHPVTVVLVTFTFGKQWFQCFKTIYLGQIAKNPSNMMYAYIWFHNSRSNTAPVMNPLPQRERPKKTIRTLLDIRGSFNLQPPEEEIITF